MSDSEERVKPRALVVGHAGFASGLISAVDQISGRGWMLVGISNAGMTPDEIEASVRQYCEQGVRVVFTDLPGGSATICARRVSAEQNEMIIVSGVNLPALLDFVLSAELPPDSAEHAAARGRAMIGVHGPA